MVHYFRLRQKRRKVSLNSSILGVLLQLVFVRNDHRDQKVLQRISVDERLGDKWMLTELVLQLLRNDVFSLRKFEDVFLSVDNFDSTVR